MSSLRRTTDASLARPTPGDGVGLDHTAISYDGTLWLGLVACRDMLPDPAHYAQCLRQSFDELHRACSS